MTAGERDSGRAAKRQSRDEACCASSGELAVSGGNDERDVPYPQGSTARRCHVPDGRDNLEATEDPELHRRKLCQSRRGGIPSPALARVVSLHAFYKPPVHRGSVPAHEID